MRTVERDEDNGNNRPEGKNNPNPFGLRIDIFRIGDISPQRSIQTPNKIGKAVKTQVLSSNFGISLLY